VYKIEQMKFYLETYHVKAKSEAEAVIMIFDLEVAPIKYAPQLGDICDDRGLPADDYPELAEALREAGIMTDHTVIPSIVSIERIR